MVWLLLLRVSMGMKHDGDIGPADRAQRNVASTGSIEASGPNPKHKCRDEKDCELGIAVRQHRKASIRKKISG